MEKSSLSKLILLIFFLHNVVQIGSSPRLNKESHVTSIDGLTFVDFQSPSPAPSVVQPVLSVPDRVGVLFASRILSESQQAGSHKVLVMVGCSFLLAGILIALTWYICVMSGSESGRGPGPSVVDRGSVPTLPTAQSVPNRRGGGGPKPSHQPAPPMAIARGDGGSKPSDSPAQPMMNRRGGGGSKSTDPRSLEYSSLLKHSYMQPRVQADVCIAQIELETRHPVRVIEHSKSNAGPSRVAEFGLIPFSYEELRVSTDDFSRTNFLGEGGFAKVYKGTLSNGRKVAVKVLKNENSKGEKEFRNEVDIISRARHKNVVSLEGYCITETQRLIVYEFVENKSLDDHLRGGKGIQFMTWAIRMKIARGASKGLAYLHEDCPQKIIHRDVKPANILLDSKFAPKVADFGIAKLCPEHFDSLIATYAIGSIGFIDPMYVETNELSFKSDVYSFGVVLLELISGHVDLARVHGLKNKLSGALRSGNFDGIADERLNLIYDPNEMFRVVSCAKACLRKEPKDRPQMIQIVRVLENALSPMELRIRTRPE